MIPDTGFDVIVVGAGVAGLSAALAAHEAGARPLVLETAPEEDRGGNSAFAAGAFRIAHKGLDDIIKIVPDLSEEEIANTDFGDYSDLYYEDMDRVTEGRSDPELTEILISRSLETAVWLRSHGVRFIPNYGNHGYKQDGKTRFRRGSTVTVSGGGLGMIDALYRDLEKKNIPVAYGTRAMALKRGDQTIEGVEVRDKTGSRVLPARSVILASGGFESNPEWRTRYLGPGWDLAKVRGTRHNMGDGHRMAMEIGAGAAGNWSGCHSVAWDLSAPEFGDRAVGVDFKKDSYVFSLVINANGERFLDEGADYPVLTYAKYGAFILRQPGQFAWQVFDGKVLDYLRDEYHIRQVTKVRADTLEELAEKLYRVDGAAFLKTVREFNEAVQKDIPFDRNLKDGRGTAGLAIPKSNWANTIDSPPFEAYAVTCGVTFTFGGLRISPETSVLDGSGSAIPGLFACGSSAGGLFYFNYPGGAGLVAAAVFGRQAGKAAAQQAGS